MSDITKTLHEQYRNDWEEAKSLLAGAADAKRELSAEEEARWTSLNDSMTARKAKMDQVAAAEERSEKIGAPFASTQSMSVTAPTPGCSRPESRQETASSARAGRVNATSAMRSGRELLPWASSDHSTAACNAPSNRAGPIFHGAAPSCPSGRLSNVSAAPSLDQPAVSRMFT